MNSDLNHKVDKSVKSFNPFNPRFYYFLIFSFLVFNNSVFADIENPVNPKKRIAVLNFSANNTNESFARIVRNNIELNLFQQNKFEVLEHDQIDFILEERKMLLSECTDEDCGTKLGEVLQAQYVILGSVSRLEKYIIQIKVIDVGKKQLIIADETEAANESELRNVSVNISLKVAEEIENIGKKGKPVSVSTSFFYTIPLSYLNDKVDPGFGVGVSGFAEDIFIKRLLFGLNIQYLYFNGKPDVTHHAYMLPVSVFTGFRLPVSKLSFIPALYAGVSYISVFYYTQTDSSEYSGNSAFEPLIKAGLDVEYSPAELFSLKLSSEYGAVFEKDGRIVFLSVGLGAGMRF